ncbi:uncharacterized protein V1510DRAFT_370230, partial [Dipodascopsis tothii]|uniref:uncharacterized protein n=1 Tax=Dipodascopsis tothii TaxID=44089 RepID=UPI0034CF2C8B
RQAELGQLQRRYPKARLDGHALHIDMAPSDPDFPFDISVLRFALTVPEDYPATAPRIRVTNTDIPRGFAVNVENGFRSQIADPGLGKLTLLKMVAQLDRRLEEFLKEERRETIKIANARAATAAPPPAAPPAETAPAPAPTAPAPPTADRWATTREFVPSAAPAPRYSAQQLALAAEARRAQIRQLQVRLRSTRLVRDAAEGSYYSVPLQPAAAGVPSSLRDLGAVTLFVPAAYNLEPCTVQLDADSTEATNVEINFLARSSAHLDHTLLAHLNYLAQFLGYLSDEHTAVPAPAKSEPEPAEAGAAAEAAEAVAAAETVAPAAPYSRPPEWDAVEDESESESEGESETESESRPESESRTESGTEPPAQPAPAAEPAPEMQSGTSVNFPGIDLQGVAVLEVVSLNLVMKCASCKSTMTDFRALRPDGTVRTAACPKCRSMQAVVFRKDTIVENARSRAGWLNLQGAVPFDVLPSAYALTCARCLTDEDEHGHAPEPTVLSGLGLAQVMTTNCRHCHARMSVRLPQPKFTKISDDGIDGAALPTRVRRPRESLGIVVGTALPDNGACKHYRKSTRWFRFSCCQKVFACDRCHNAQSDHADEHANRMICGMCSREQNYAPETCAYCRHAFFRKRTGFWEGGRGTRDRVAMSRKDPRKYKRRT